MARITFNVPNRDNLYVFIPACCYAGNRFQVRKYDYPPMFRAEEARKDMPVTITDIPRLNPDGSGRIEVTTADASMPCIGVFSPEDGYALLLFTVQQIDGLNLGLAYGQGRITLTWPAERHEIYRWNHMVPNDTPWEDRPAVIPYHKIEFHCTDLKQFFRVYLENRKCMGMDDSRPQTLPWQKQRDIQLRKINRRNWLEDLGIYTVGIDFNNKFDVWQPGWVGGAMTGYALMCLGGEQEWIREARTLDFLFRHQGESGLYYGIVDRDGRIWGDSFQTPGVEDWTLVRKSSDVLYFLVKHFRLYKASGRPIPSHWLAGASKTADAFVRIWRKNGQLGQFLDVHTGEICVGGSTSASTAPAGLAALAAFYRDSHSVPAGNRPTEAQLAAWLQTAEEAAEYFYKEHLCRGYTTGGPGEILQCPDSESAFGLLESFIVLYETTGNRHWLDCAEMCAAYASSWVVGYNFAFPQESEFGRLGMRSVGSVFANLQNKHSAPGICTLSGDSLLKLWRWTGNRLYLALCKDIALSCGQYLSTEARPIYDWDLTQEERRRADPAVLAAHRLPDGCMCERVNLSDWEGPQRVGGVFHGSCWCETSNLLSIAEVIRQLTPEEQAES